MLRSTRTPALAAILLWAAGGPALAGTAVDDLDERRTRIAGRAEAKCVLLDSSSREILDEQCLRRLRPCFPGTVPEDHDGMIAFDIGDAEELDGICSASLEALPALERSLSGDHGFGASGGKPGINHQARIPSGRSEAAAGAATHAPGEDTALLDTLLGNGLITRAQYDRLMKKGTTDTSVSRQEAVAVPSAVDKGPERQGSRDTGGSAAGSKAGAPKVNIGYTDKGFRLETSDGRFQTNLQWRAQMRYTYPYRSDPRQVSAFEGDSESTFELRRVRMKIGGHGYQPWLKYYFELDLQPTREVDDSSSSSSTRVIDWRIDVARWSWATLRVGQWKIDLNRERVDSSGRQQFVERSIVNRVFTIDRQMGVQLRGRLFDETPADLRYWVGVFTGEGRGVSNTDNNMMYMGRLQWNFLGRDLSWRQTDVERTEKPAGSLAFGASTNKGVCTRWSSSGCGNLDGYESPATAEAGQFDIDQWVQELAFKWRGFSFQQEYHRKTINDTVNDTEEHLTGAYAQVGYFFHEAFPAFPEPLEIAVRYAKVDEPNAVDRGLENEREERTVGLNWFFNGHNNKLTLDWSHLTLDDELLDEDESDGRLRLQWDISF